MTCEEALRGDLVDARLTGFDVGGVPTRFEGSGDDVRLKTLAPELEPQRPLAARPHPVPRLQPGLGERLVVEDAEPGQLLDGAVDELRAIARSRQPPANLVGRALTRLEEAQRRLENDRRFLDFGVPRAALRRRDAALPEGYSASSMPSTGTATVAIAPRIRPSMSAAIAGLPFRNSFEASRP